MASMLEVENIRAAYGRIEVIEDMSLNVNQGEIVTIVGRNGAGKTTTLKTISGMLKARGGKVRFEGKDITGQSAHNTARLGLNLVPEGRQIFTDQSVMDNLILGRNTGRLTKAEATTTLDQIFAIFPRLKERQNQQARTLSGGEQQMLAIGRALMSKPVLLMLDEPSLGLAPLFVQKIADTLVKLNKENGLTILLVEQMQYALKIADRAYVIKNGGVVWQGTGAQARVSNEVREAYLGKAHDTAPAANTTGKPPLIMP